MAGSATNPFSSRPGDFDGVVGGGFFGTGFRVVQPPSVWMVNFSSDLLTLIFIVGDPVTSPTRRFKASYRIYFAPIDLASPAAMSDPQAAYHIFTSQAKQIASGDAPQNGGTISIPNVVYAGLDGWFWATAVNLYGIESKPTPPARNPIVGGNDSRVAPDVLNQTATLTDAGLDPWGRQLIKVIVTADVPYQTQGVSFVEMENNGTDYTHDFPVIFTNADGDTTGNGAAGIAHVRDGGVTGVEVTAAGQEYTLSPVVHFTNGDGIGADARAILTTTGSFSAFQIYLFNYFQSGTFQEGPSITSPTFGGKSSGAGTLAHGSFLLYPDAPPAHNVQIHFVSLSQTATRRVDPFNAPFVAFPTGIHL